MREAIRRILWFVPTLAIVTLIAFGALAYSFDGQSSTPLFFNPRPSNIERLAWLAAKRYASEPNQNTAKQSEELLKLGGAALPHILPRLDSMSPQERHRVALALLPLGKRMKLDAPLASAGGAQALHFWLRFWENHAVDFEEVSVRRVVKRFAKRVTPLRRREVMRLDTHALPEVLAQMKVTPSSHIANNLVDVATDITKNRQLLPPTKVNGSHDSVDQWQRWWSLERAHYTQPQGFERLLSPLLQTRYATWAREATRTRFGRTVSGDPALDVLRAAAPVSLWLLLIGVVLGSALGTGIAASLHMAGRVTFKRARFGLALLCCVMAIFAWYLLSGSANAGHYESDIRGLVAGSIVLFAGTCMATRQQLLAFGRFENKPWLQTYRTLGLSPGRIIRLLLHRTSGAVIRATTARIPVLFSIIVVIEHALALQGVGYQTVLAIHQRDTTWLMLTALATASLMACLHLLCDLLIRALQPWHGRLNLLEEE